VESNLNEFPMVLTIYLELSQYPILASRVREHMRQELFKRGVITPEAFESEVQEKAIQSQKREGITEPFSQEPPEDWMNRQTIVRDHLTDFYFAHNLPHELFENLLRQALSHRVSPHEVVPSIHPELAPLGMLFARGEAYEALGQEERTQVEHHLEQIKVVLIKAMISDHLEYVGIAKEWFDIADLQAIRARRIGSGKIGGKAAGIMLAECALRKSVDQEFLQYIRIPESWFLGADVFYQFIQLNGLNVFANEKYKSEPEIRSDYPTIRDQFREGRFPDEIVESLETILERVGRKPIIVRSSSLLEDSFGTSFAGKYESYFCPNQGTPEENMVKLLDALTQVYASVYSPDALLYRSRMALIDYDERMAILIQEVQGKSVGHYFFPDAAGVALSRNQFRWSPRIDRRAGFLRLVWGLGTRAVEQVGGGYPRLVALSHPTVWPKVEPDRIRRYSQAFVDLIDLKNNMFCSLPVAEVITSHTPFLRLIAQAYQPGLLQDFVGIPLSLDPNQVVITLGGLLKNTNFPKLMRDMLTQLEWIYKGPVDTEFALLLEEGGGGKVKPIICLLQCRPQSYLRGEAHELPEDVPPDRRLFVTHQLVPDGWVSDVRYAIYIIPRSYHALPRPEQKLEVARTVGRLNRRLNDETFILLGPGRWGSNNPDLGIPVTYSEIHNARALIEVVDDETAPEPSYGTHFFQDMVEAQIYPLVLALMDPEVEFTLSFFEESDNVLAELLPEDKDWEDTIRVIDIPTVSDGALLDLAMDGDAGVAMAYLRSVIKGD
jgi:hypothetical protein